MNKGKVVIVGTGTVGTTYAYALINQSIVSELILIDIDEKRAQAEVMDLNHGLYYANELVNVRKGTYADCHDADIVCLTAGLSQDGNATRLDFSKANTEIFKSIIPEIIKSQFDGIFIVATNPVDIMTQVTKMLSGYPAHKVIGSGTLLDTSRYCYLLSKHLNVNIDSIKGYIIGEHGDSQVAAISTTTIGEDLLTDVIGNNEQKKAHISKLVENVRDAASQVLQGKHATHYGIGLGLVRLTKAVLQDEHAILPISSFVQGEYGFKDVYFGTPAVIGSEGVIKIVELKLNEQEQKRLNNSIKVITDNLTLLNL